MLHITISTEPGKLLDGKQMQERNLFTDKGRKIQLKDYFCFCKAVSGWCWSSFISAWHENQLAWYKFHHNEHLVHFIYYFSKLCHYFITYCKQELFWKHFIGGAFMCLWEALIPEDWEFTQELQHFEYKKFKLTLSLPEGSEFFCQGLFNNWKDQLICSIFKANIPNSTYFMLLLFVLCDYKLYLGHFVEQTID